MVTGVKRAKPSATWDASVGALYVYLRHGSSARTVVLRESPLVAIDYDSQGGVLGVEVLCPPMAKVTKVRRTAARKARRSR